MWVLLGIAVVLAIVAVPIALIVLLATRLGRKGPEREGGRALHGYTPVRIYQYLVSFAGLIVGLVGLSFLLQRFFEELAPTDALLANPSETRFATGLAMLAIGGIVWGIHWIAIQRHVQGAGPGERSIPERRIALRLTAFVAMVLLFIAFVRLLRWAATADDFSGYPFAATLVWGIAWAVHQRMADREMQAGPERDGLWQMAVYATALYTLATGVSGAAGMLNELFNRVRESIFDAPPILVASGLDTEALQGGLAVAIAGVAAWGFHWLFLARNDRESAGRAVAGFLAGLGATVTLVVAASIFFFGMAWWFLAPPGELFAGAHYRFFAGVLAAGIPASVVAGYFHIDFHSRAGTVGRRAADVRNLMLGALSLLGLAALGLSIVFFAGSVIGALSQPARGLLVNEEWWRRPIATGIATGVLGIPLWLGAWLAWRRLGDRVNRDLARGYLYLVMGLAMLAVIGSGAHALYSLLRDVVDDSFRGSWLREGRWSVGVFIAAGAMALYHWRVTREAGLAARPTDAPPPATVSHAAPAHVRVMALGAPAETVAEVQASLGEGAQVMERESAGREVARLPLTALSALPEIVRLHGGKRLLLAITKDEVRIYEE